MGNLIIRPGGFVVYFFSFLIIMFLSPIYYFLIGKATLGFLGLVSIIIYIIFLGYMLSYIFRYLFDGNKIILTDQELIIHNWKAGVVPGRAMFPKIVAEKVSLKNIEYVTLGKAKHFDEISEKQDNKFLKEKLEPLKIGPSRYAPLGTWTGMQYSPLLYIVEKNKTQHLISTKPYGKKDFMTLLAELKKRGIQVLDVLGN